MEFDEVLSLIGDLGRYQRWMFVLLCVPAGLPSAVLVYSHIFISAVPEHHCHAAVTAEKASLLNRSLTHPEDYLNALNSLFLPRDGTGGFAKCLQYDVDVNSAIDRVLALNERLNVSIIDDFVARNRWPLVQCLNGWDYDTHEYIETLATKFNVVCNQEWLISTAQSAFFVGGMIGCLLIGAISDKWGRRTAFFLSTTMMMVGSLAVIFPPNYIYYILMRFVVGFCYPSVYQTAFLIVAEMIGVTKRTASAILCHIAFSAGMMLFAVVSHFINHWQTLQAVTALPMLLLIGYYWLVPESPRWLLSQGRVDDAEVVVQQMANVNGVSLPVNFLRSKMAERPSMTPSYKEELKETGISNILKYPKVLMKMIVISFVWTVIAMVYNGISFAVPDLASEAYVAFFFTALVEVPGVLTAWYTMGRYGRKFTMLTSLILSGVLSIATAFVPSEIQWLAVLLPSLAKLGVSAAFVVVYMFASELFPTVIRGVAIGIASTASQLGLVVTPYILFLGKIYGRTVPFVILGLLSSMAALLMLTLPETLNAPLPSTMQEAEDYHEYVKEKKASADMHVVVQGSETLAKTKPRRNSLVS